MFSVITSGLHLLAKIPGKQKRQYVPLIYPPFSPIKNRNIFSRCIFLSVIIFLVGLGTLFKTDNASAAISADKIKAAYIYQLIKFVTWPDTPTITNKAFAICIIGKESIRDNFKSLGQKKIKGQLINIRYPSTVRDTVGCNILYIAKTEQRQLQTIINHSRNKPILTISSIPGFMESGGIIGFVIINNKVRLEINRTSARHANIQLSAKLLEVASVIHNDATEENQP